MAENRRMAFHKYFIITFFQPLLPSSFSLDDIQQLLQQCMKGRVKSGARIMCQTVVCSEKFLSEARALFGPLMTQKAEKVSN